MDFGDIIYVILAIVFSAAGALGKRKKRPQTQQKKSSAVQDIFNEMFESDKVDDPVQQAQYYNEEELMAEYEKSNIEDFEEENKVEEKVEYQPLFTAVDNTFDSAIESTLETQTPVKKHHPLIADLRSRNELKRAFVYSEIFKPKFDS